MIVNSGCSLNTAAGKKGAYRDLFYSETPLTQEVILAVCANEQTGIFGEQNWWFNARSYGLCWSLVRSFVHTYLKQDGTPFTAADKSKQAHQRGDAGIAGYRVTH